MGAPPTNALDTAPLSIGADVYRAMRRTWRKAKIFNLSSGRIIDLEITLETIPVAFLLSALCT